MHWIDACTEPRAYRFIEDSNIATNPITHGDHPVAVWIEPGAGKLLSPQSKKT